MQRAKGISFFYSIQQKEKKSSAFEKKVAVGRFLAFLKLKTGQEVLREKYFVFILAFPIKIKKPSLSWDGFYPILNNYFFLVLGFVDQGL